MNNIFKKFIESIKKMPLVYMLGVAWIGLTVFAVASGRISDDLLTSPAFAKAMTKEVIDEDNFREFEMAAVEADDASIGGTTETDANADEGLDETADTAAQKNDETAVDATDTEADSAASKTQEQESATGEEAAGEDEASDETLNEEDSEADGEPVAEPESEAEDEHESEPENKPESEAEAEPESEPAPETKPVSEIVESDNVVYETYTPQTVDSQYYDDPGLIPLTTEYDYITEEDYSYFDDALFIGDSRMVGLRDYSGLNDHAQFAAMTGLTIYDALDAETATDPSTGKSVNAQYLLEHYNYGKIYICVGINELGIGNTPYFADHFKDVLEKIRSYQPDAVIYIQSIMAVSQKKNDSDSVFNNMNINDKNAAIAKFADGKTIFYLNINEFFTDRYYTPHSGALLADLTTDQVHVYGRCYADWADILLRYGVVAS